MLIGLTVPNLCAFCLCIFARPPGLCNNTRGDSGEIRNTGLWSAFQAASHSAPDVLQLSKSIPLHFCRTQKGLAKAQEDARESYLIMQDQIEELLKNRQKDGMADLLQASSCGVAQPWGRCKSTRGRSLGHLKMMQEQNAELLEFHEQGERCKALTMPARPTQSYCQRIP